jgi:Cu/Ag efflux protein CusF
MPGNRMEIIMRKYLAPLLIALAVAAPGAAFAAGTMAPAAKPAAATQADQTISGTVKAFDLKAQTLTLADGMVYQLPATFKDPGLKNGEKVTVHWKMNGTAHEATNVTIG